MDTFTWNRELCKMKNFVFLVVILACFAGTAVHGQANNYLLSAYESALELKAAYHQQIMSWRDWLTIEAGDVGFYFTNIVARALDRSPNEVQGAGITSCVNTTVTYSRININNMDDELRATQEAAVNLHNSVMLQLLEMNIKENDLEMFYYYHSLKMQEAYDQLWNEYYVRLETAREHLYDEWFTRYSELDGCITTVFPFQ